MNVMNKIINIGVATDKLPTDAPNCVNREYSELYEHF